MNGLIDVHCHLTEEEEYESVGGVSAVLALAKERGVERLIVSGFDLPSSQKAQALAEENVGVYFSAGFQPEEIAPYETACAEAKQEEIPSAEIGADQKDAFGAALQQLATLLSHRKCVAVGEIGLDYHFPDNPSRELQREAFIRQLLLANEAGLPVVVHSRDACADTIAILKEYRKTLQRGFLMHCFSYSAETIEEFVALGGYFSFGGVATFKKAEKVKRAACAVPKNRILTETDCPYLSPEPLRGVFPNTPANIAHTVKYLAELRGEDIEEFKHTVATNAQTLFSKLAE